MTKIFEENLILSNKGGRKIAFEGYFMNYKETNGNQMIWRCNKRRCSSRLKTSLTYDLISYSTHNHCKDDFKFDRVMMAASLKKRVLTTEETGRNMIVSAIVDSNLTVFNNKTMLELLNRTRVSNNLTIVRVYDIPVELQKTFRNRKFLFYDSGMKDENRVVVFTTYQNLEHFKFSNVVVCDGTFKSAPSCFDQLFTVQCNVRNDNLPLIYCFMKSRSEACYDKFFEWLSLECKEDIMPKNVILDFEAASFNSCKKFFKDSTFWMCFSLRSNSLEKNPSIEICNNIYRKQ